jgi:perosamine synthetase
MPTLRLVPPAGTPLRISQVFGALIRSFLANGDPDRTLKALAAYLHAKHTFVFSSGRAGLWAILKTLHRLRPARNVVAIPAYICFSVPASIVRAGLKIRPVEVDPETLDYDFSKLAAAPNETLLCVMASNLFGLPSDMARIQAVGRAKGAFVIDNAAQSLGAVLSGHHVGTGGDVGLYSLGRGKALTTLEGGVVVTNSDEIAEALREVVSGLPVPTALHGAALFFQMLAYAILLTPRLYWIPNSLPFLNVGVTEFNPNFPVATMAPVCKALVCQTIRQIDKFNQTRRNNALSLCSALEGCTRLRIPRLTPGSEGIYIRLPLIAADEATRRSALQKLHQAGFAASPFYPSAICDIPEIAGHMASADFHCPAAESLARRLMTVPTHPLVTERDRQRMLEVLSNL